MRLKPFITNLILLALTILVCLGVAEILVRVSGLDRDASAELRGGKEYDSLLGWQNKPLSTTVVATRESLIQETFNSLGVRGPERAIPKPRDVRRVLLLGDSFVEGYTVEYGATCAAVLERLLSVGSAQVEVINGGTSGFSTDQELLFYTSRMRTYKPDVVVLLFYVNDVWFNAQNRYWRGFKPQFMAGPQGLVLTNVPVPLPEAPGYAFRIEGGRGLVGLVRRSDAALGRASAIYRLFRRILTSTPALRGILTRHGFAIVPDEFRPWKTTPDPALATAWHTTELLLARLRDETAKDGATLVVFHVPDQAAIYESDWQQARRMYALDEGSWSPRQDAVVLKEICARQGLRCIFPEASFRLEAVRLGNSKGRLYLRLDPHWTAAGNSLAARLIATVLESIPGWRSLNKSE